MSATARINLTEFKQLARDIAPACRAVLMARAYAQTTRQHVDAYEAPIFARYTFYVAERWSKPGQPRKRITTIKDLYLTDDDAQCKALYAELDAAHRAHGFTGPDGHCPALIAESLVITTENALIALTCDSFGIEPYQLQLENRTKFLDLMIGAGIKAESDTKAGR